MLGSLTSLLSFLDSAGTPLPFAGADKNKAASQVSGDESVVCRVFVYSITLYIINTGKTVLYICPIKVLSCELKHFGDVFE